MKLLLGFLISGLILNFPEISAQESEVLLFYKTEGFHHQSIPTGIETIKNLGKTNNFEVTATNDAVAFSSENLEKYDLVIFLNTTGNVLNEKQQNAFETYMKKGGNYFGIHAAADTEFNWPWYGKLVGAYFVSHPKVQEAKIRVEKANHPSVAHLPQVWIRKDEWYNFKNINPRIIVLLSLDESSYQGGKNGKKHPIAWYHKLDGGGTAIYTGGGHTVQSYSEPAFREHVLQSILFAIGEKRKKENYE